jgi:putative zinc finger protein
VYSCSDVLTELGNYLDDDVAMEVRSQLEQHLAHCKTCKVIYDSTRKTLKVVTDSESFELPEEFSESLVDKIMSKIRSDS